MLMPPKIWKGFDKCGHLLLPSYVMRTHGAKERRDSIKSVPRKQLSRVSELEASAVNLVAWEKPGDVYSGMDNGFKPMAAISSSSCCNPHDQRSWNRVMKRELLGGNNRKVITMYVAVQDLGMFTDNYNLPVLFQAASNLLSMSLGVALHCQAIKSGYALHPFVQTSLINMYSVFNCLDNVRKVFDGMSHRDVVAWNSMLDAYASHGMMDECVELFESMPVKDQITFNIMTSGHANIGSVDGAKKMFDRSPAKDIFTWNSLLSTYVRAGSMDLARALFDRLPNKDIVSWNTLLDGYLQNENYDQVLHSFDQMLFEEQIEPNSVTLVIALSACAHVGNFVTGTEIHVYAQMFGFSSDPHVATALIDMYSKCGIIEEALKVFHKTQKDIYCWNSMISGLALQGYGNAALKLFNNMQRDGLKPDDITFIGLLCACSHAGLVSEGLQLFKNMERQHGLTPKSEHYGCLVDLLGRAGYVDQAYQIVKKMPFQPTAETLGALLSACIVHGNAEVGEELAEDIARRGDRMGDGEYMMLVNFYAMSGQWQDAMKWREMMGNRGVIKEAGYSEIIVDGKVHRFLAGDIDAKF